MSTASAAHRPILALGAKLLLAMVVLAAVFLRLWQLGSLPGINGDEAWYGVQAQRLIAGTGGELRTPTGNVPGLLHLGSLSLLHAFLPPSGLLLRLPALLSSLAAMALAYVTARRFFGPSAGMAALVLMACLPVNIAYARMGWDPSHAPIFVIAATYAALDRRRLLAALLFALALANHPAALFTAPFLTLSLLGAERKIRPWKPAILSTAAFAAMLLLAILLSLALSPNSAHYVVPAKILSRLFDPGQWLAFGTGFVRLLSGETIYQSIAGDGFGAALTAIDLVTAGLLVALASAGLFVAFRSREWLMVGLLLGWVASLLSLFLVAGRWALEPGLERFGFPLAGPTALVYSAILAALIPPTRTILLQSILVLCGAAMLAGFWRHYFVPLDHGASRSSKSLWIGYPDLNRPAFDRVSAMAGPGRSVIVAEDWWIKWPLAYAATDSRFDIRDLSEAPIGATSSKAAYWIAYAGGTLDRELARRGDLKLRGSVSTPDRRNTLNIWSGKTGR